MSKSRVMLVGAAGSGKSTLAGALNREPEGIRKTQSVEYFAGTIDTPGEFMENPFYYRALFATSQDAGMILFVQDAARKSSVFPPGFAGAFARQTMGVVTKTDHPEADVEKAGRFLRGLGLNGPIVKVSAFTGEGLEHLRKLLNLD